MPTKLESNQITEDRFQKTVINIKDDSGNTVFGWLLKITDQEKQKILQALRLSELVKNTTIDMTERERSLLNLLLKQSFETSRGNGNE